MVDDITPKQAWDALRTDPQAQLIDVRTDAEWQYVGLPDLRPSGKQALLIAWQHFPSGRINPRFIDELLDAGLKRDQKLLFLCRSGARSLSAAQTAQEAGFELCLNVAHGFEGIPDAHGHRGKLTGWKADGLPWRQ